MHLLVYGPGRLGGAIAAGARDADWSCDLVGRPPADSWRPPAPVADIVIDASLGSAAGGLMSGPAGGSGSTSRCTMAA